ncbi:EVE domain-containing protein [Heliobacterium gestii]|uniref:EVE domain-containing protein n=1 Tax=Heliomicrobium gestii TaxID=2699 RepID=A0A845LJD3_HELGE|nr:AAA family ATPase [Heliomicrobium gestii]MBM7868341.1 5-methylcytosine-specific restriction protein B [Heliomicrobium gestii]MZP44505.1 EVE domain-containing protein [Heliomicrobium gestii]
MTDREISIKSRFEAYLVQYGEEKLCLAGRLHEDFLREFPRPLLPELSLERYALGKSKTGSFSWWLEYNTLPLGSIRGGTAIKHVIFYSAKEAAWKYPEPFRSPEDAWKRLRADLIRLIEEHDGNDAEGVDDDSPLNGKDMLKGKVLFLYHPDKFLPVYKLEHLHQFLEELDVPPSEWQGRDNISCNLRLKEVFHGFAREGFGDEGASQIWAHAGAAAIAVAIKDFLYSQFTHEEKYYKIAPGEGAALWPECLAGGYISIGWNEMGDLRQYPDYDEFKSAFLKHDFHDNVSANTRKANELWSFYNLKPGDYVIANKGMSQIVGVGRVNEKGYAFREDLSTFQHVVYVDWEKSFDPPLPIAKQSYWGMTTMKEVTHKNYVEWIAGGDGTAQQGKGSDKPPMPAPEPFPFQAPPEGKIPLQWPVAETFTAEEERFFVRLEKSLERKGQCILYGPPGTGKTFLARKFIRWKYIKDKLLTQADAMTANVWIMVTSPRFEFRWQDILNNGSAQEFNVRAVQRNYRRARPGDKVLCYQSGKGAGEATGFVGIAEVAGYLDEARDVLPIKGARAFANPIPYDIVKTIPEYQQTQAGKMGNRGTLFEATADFAAWVKNYLADNDDREAARLLEGVTSKRIHSELCTFHPSFNYEDFIEGFKPAPTENGQVAFCLEKGIFVRFCHQAEEHEPMPHYLIIDEINRGNVPKIFGELITLLEKDKRGVEVILPQSKERFSIPASLYIIGTMNTSDRSIKMMDAALKRRFAFIECMPDLDLLDYEIDGLGLRLKTILEEINRCLVEFGGRDKQIGHAYLMQKGEPIRTIEELKGIYELEIIPLVQEYCFDDYAKLSEIVGADFVDINNMTINSEIFQESDDIFISALVKRFQSR